MAMKRKRSCTSLLPHPTSSEQTTPASTQHSYLPRFYPQRKSSIPRTYEHSACPKPLQPCAAISPPQCRQAFSDTEVAHTGDPSNLSGRTQKRYRDARPSEASVHASTLHLLFAAQRRPHVSPPATPSGEREDDMDMSLDWVEGDAAVAQEEHGACQSYQLDETEKGQKSLDGFFAPRREVRSSTADCEMELG